MSPATCKAEEGVVVPTPTLPKAVTLKMEVPEEELTLKGSRVVVPWTLKLIVEEVALAPATVPLSKRMPVVRAEAEDHLVTKPVVPEPLKLLEAFKVLPVKDKPVPRVTDWRFLSESDMTKELAVRVATLTLPKGETWK